MKAIVFGRGDKVLNHCWGFKLFDLDFGLVDWKVKKVVGEYVWNLDW